MKVFTSGSAENSSVKVDCFDENMNKIGVYSTMKRAAIDLQIGKTPNYGVTSISKIIRGVSKTVFSKKLQKRVTFKRSKND